MADKKITQLNAMTAPSLDDLLVLVNDPGGTPETQKLTVENFGQVVPWFIPNNLLINGGFQFFQRQAPATLTSRADDAYGPDRWYILAQTAAIQCARAAGDTNSAYAVQLKQNQAAAQRMGQAQIVESVNSIPLRGRPARFQVRVKPSISQTIRAALLAWTGTGDAVTSDVVNDWASASYTAGGFFLGASLSVVGVGSVAPGAGAYADLAAFGTVPAGCTNLIAVVWTEGVAAQNFTLDITQAGIYDGAPARPWLPRPLQQEMALCQRFYEKSMPIDTEPADNISIDNGNMYTVTPMTSNFNSLQNIYFVVSKRVTPTMYLFNPLAVDANNKIRDYTASTNLPGLTRPSQTGVRVLVNNVSVVAAHELMTHWVADAEL